MRGGGGAKLPGLGLVSTLLRSESPSGQAPVDTPILDNTHENTGTAVSQVSQQVALLERILEHMPCVFNTQQKKEVIILFRF